MSALQTRQSNCYMLSSSALSEPLTTTDFDAALLSRNGLVESQADGRGSAWFIRLGAERAVLRHYYRGGLIAKLSRDRFVWSGIERSRAIAEYRLLAWMCEQGLPVPEPLGARVQLHGLFYSCDLITRTIPNTKTLADRISRTAILHQYWRHVGIAVRRLHDAGVWHADLNAKNILLDDEGVVSLIDFDRCRQRKGGKWKADNLTRLRRSLDKLKGLGKVRHFNELNWQSLLLGYQR